MESIEKTWTFSFSGVTNFVFMNLKGPYTFYGPLKPLITYILNSTIIEDLYSSFVVVIVDNFTSNST